MIQLLSHFGIKDYDNTEDICYFDLEYDTLISKYNFDKKEKKDIIGDEIIDAFKKLYEYEKRKFFQRDYIGLSEKYTIDNIKNLRENICSFNRFVLYLTRINGKYFPSNYGSQEQEQEYEKYYKPLYQLYLNDIDDNIKKYQEENE